MPRSWGSGRTPPPSSITKAGFSFWPSFLIAGLVAGLVGAILAIPCLRVREDFLAITTMGINFVIEAVFLYIPFFGAGMGIGGIDPPSFSARRSASRDSSSWCSS